ncbi:hypothetical protein EUA35_08070 [Bacillus subtilis]|nr:hypothetical protein [Bacillus subtilis]TWP00501.1 hypothetical protein EUA35_08070 [Bacillus subtilis]
MPNTPDTAARVFSSPLSSMTPIDYGHAGLHHNIQKKVLTKLQKGILNAAIDSKKIIIVCMTFKKSLKLKKNSFFHFFSLLKFSSENAILSDFMV